MYNGHDFDGGYPFDFEDQQTAATHAQIEAAKIALSGPYPARRSIVVQRHDQHGDKVDFTEVMTFNIEANSQRVDLVTEVLP